MAAQVVANPASEQVRFFKLLPENLRTTLLSGLLDLHGSHTKDSI
jgi:hypothetical protein